ncbi:MULTISPECIES: winged helix-turn-helix transcriptional regulator [Asaia]|uniref:winged helix-turn-helix transcriptional regulator n=1 Tax=Asaia TaxID=91914 RepID=UPI002556AD64|nr:helix-turn-helix domain-containing protein [Asaia sp. HumB]MDL2171140.1 helix-turn-helix domain-containing protein [Asaia sp. HumB]
MKKLKRWEKTPGCSLEATLDVIGGKWKGVFLYHLLDGTMRFNALSRLAKGASPRLVVKQLRELECDGLVIRTVYPVIPPRVEYSLTVEGETLRPLLTALSAWGDAWLEKRPALRPRIVGASDVEK